MKERLQGPALLRTADARPGQLESRPGEEAVLIGETPEMQTALFCALGEIRPFYVCGDVALSTSSSGEDSTRERIAIAACGAAPGA